MNVRRWFRFAAVLLTLAIGSAASFAMADCDCYVPCDCDAPTLSVRSDGLPGESLPGESLPGDALDPMESPSNSLSSDPQFNVNEQFGAMADDLVSAQMSNGGYIDPAMIRTQYRIRLDAAYNNPIPDRAEFFYPLCGCFNNVNANLNAQGPPLPETGVDYLDVRNYFEYAVNDRISGFVDIPIRWINPDNNANTVGLGDIITGFKYAVIRRSEGLLTFQLKVYTPTGDGDRGLGTQHVSIEPGLLFFRQLSPTTTLEGELRNWTPLSNQRTPDGNFAAGNVIRYGVGIGHDLVQSCRRGTPSKLTGVVEVVGWQITGGQGFDANIGQLVDAADDHIVNLKVGARWTSDLGSMYVGYGHGLTQDIWYRDIVRAEYRMTF